MAELRAIATDPEVAHATEDEIHQWVLQGIADGTCGDPAGCAAAALKTSEVSFSRWYA